MSESEIEMWSTLAIWFIGIIFFGYTIGWCLFLYVFNFLDNFLQERSFRKKGYIKMIDEKGKTWYVG